jgi:hypothetical protein
LYVISIYALAVPSFGKQRLMTGLMPFIELARGIIILIVS